jgi:hypothetical protein
LRPGDVVVGVLAGALETKVRPAVVIASSTYLAERPDALVLAEETGLIVEVQHQFRVYEVINAPQEHRIIIYSWAKAIGGDLRASDDISEVKFVPIDELGDLPLTPLVKAVLTDAARTISRRSKGQTPRKTRGLRVINPIYGQGSLLLELAEAD